VVVNGANVTAYGLAVEHFQKSETVWNGQGGTVVFQNENPYDVPNQAAGCRQLGGTPPCGAERQVIDLRFRTTAPRAPCGPSCRWC
jgi:hypothetical protein